jgi:threonine/homoserine/homoserine lactone efflux protein
MAVRILQGIAFGFLVESATDEYGEAAPAVIKSILLLLLGILLLIAAYKKWQKAEDPDAPPPRWMKAFSGLSPLKALGVGALIAGIDAKQWVITLSAIGVIADAELAQGQTVALFLVYVLIAASLPSLPIIASLLAPQQARFTLTKAQQWMDANSRPITIVASLAFGLLYLYNGLTGLIG